MSVFTAAKAKLLRKVRTYMQDDRGVTAIEFAFVGPVFIVLLVSILDTGTMLFTEYTLQSSVQDAARLVRTGQAQGQSMNAQTFKDKICERTRLLADCQKYVTVYLNSAVDFAALNTAVTNHGSIGGQMVTVPGVGGNPPTEEYQITPQPYSCGGPSQAVALIATYDWQYLLPFMGSWMNALSDGSGWNAANSDSSKLEYRRLSGVAMFRNEPFPTVNGASC
jgi:Flp pilus assembly pilin Flp